MNLVNKMLVIICSILFINTLSHADSTRVNVNSKSTVFQELGKDLGIFASDWGAYLTTPLRMDGKDFFVTSSVIIGTVISSTADLEARQRFSEEGYENYNSDFWDIPTLYGSAGFQGVISSVMYAAGLFGGNDWLRTTGRQLIQALAYDGTLALGIKFALGRHRPYAANNNQYEFDWFETNVDNQALPSGHMLVATTASTILAERIDTWWARAILYPAALLTGYSRIRNDKHWLSDVVFGGALGYGTARFVLNQEESREVEKKKKQNKGGGLSFMPTGNGILISYGF